MKRRVHCRLIVSNDADGTQIRDAVIADLAGKNIFDQARPVAFINSPRSGRFIQAEIRFNNSTHATQLIDQIEAKWTSGPLRTKILVGSMASIHNCTHDDPVILNCSTRAFSMRTKV